MPSHTSLVLTWPGVSVRIVGENLQTVLRQIALRRASVWRSYDPEYHSKPAAGVPIIHSIQVIDITNEPAEQPTGSAADREPGETLALVRG